LETYGSGALLVSPIDDGQDCGMKKLMGLALMKRGNVRIGSHVNNPLIQASAERSRWPGTNNSCNKTRFEDYPTRLYSKIRIGKYLGDFEQESVF